MKYVAGKALRVDADQRRLRMDVAHQHGDSGFRPASLRIEFTAFETEDAKVSELRREVSFRALGRLNPDWSGAHKFIISAHSC